MWRGQKGKEENLEREPSKNCRTIRLQDTTLRSVRGMLEDTAGVLDWRVIGSYGWECRTKKQFFLVLDFHCPFHPRITTVARKRPGHSAKKARGRSQLKTHISLTEQTQSRLTMLCRNSVRTYQKASSHATRLGTLVHSRLRFLKYCGQIMAQKVEMLCASWIPLQNKVPAGNNSSDPPPPPRKRTANAHMIHIQVQNWKKTVNVMSL